MKSRVRLFAVLAAATLLSALGTVQPATAVTSSIQFLSSCNYLTGHSAAFDPIKYHGTPPPIGHLHDFFGNKSIAYDSTDSSLENTTLGTTCLNNGDTGAYWVPSGVLPTGVVTPDKVVTYWINAVPQDGTTETFPDNAQMIAGNSGATAVQSTSIITWHCDNLGNAPTSPKLDHPYDCTPWNGSGSGCTHSCSGLIGQITFPPCWDGSANPTYGVTGVGLGNFDTKSNGACQAPTSHYIPQLVIHVHYGIMNPTRNTDPLNTSYSIPFRECTMDICKFSLSSGGWWTLHADFWNSWNQSFMDGLVHDCLNQFDTSRCGMLPTT